MALVVTAVGSVPLNPVFDGSNIWLPNENSNSQAVVRARDEVVLAYGKWTQSAQPAAFDGQRILVTNYAGNSVSMWATDLTSDWQLLDRGICPSTGCLYRRNQLVDHTAVSGDLARF
jgi:hypothetical protein